MQRFMAAVVCVLCLTPQPVDSSVALYLFPVPIDSFPKIRPQNKKKKIAISPSLQFQNLLNHNPCVVMHIDSPDFC